MAIDTGENILEFVKENPSHSSKEIHIGLEREISNAILISDGYCPLSFRTIDSVEYKKAMLLFYEQNNITAFKKIFIDQFEFAVNSYF